MRFLALAAFAVLTVAPAAAGPYFRAVERRMFELTNQQRSLHGLRALTWNDRALFAAREHSQEMAFRGYFSHDSPMSDRRTVRERCEREGLVGRSLGENLAMYAVNDASEERLAELMIEGLMASPGHRRNILSPAWTELSVGVDFGAYPGTSAEAVFATQVFLGPPPR